MRHEEPTPLHPALVRTEAADGPILQPDHPDPTPEEPTAVRNMAWHVLDRCSRLDQARLHWQFVRRPHDPIYRVMQQILCTFRACLPEDEWFGVVQGHMSVTALRARYNNRIPDPPFVDRPAFRVIVGGVGRAG